MDCHVFRCLCAGLAPVLNHSRVGKIYQPAPAITMFEFYGNGLTHFLFLRAGHKDPFLFLSQHRVPVNTAPPALVMRLRKYLSGKRIRSVVADWPDRRLYLHITAEYDLYLLLDLREGPSLIFSSPQLPQDPVWPDPVQWQALCAGTGWRNWPVLTPALRRTLPLLDTAEQAALLCDLEIGGGDLFIYTDTRQNQTISAWPLPPQLRLERTESVVDDPIIACAEVGETVVLRTMATQFREQAAHSQRTEIVRLTRLLHKLATERERLQAMRIAQDTALLLQANLFRFSPLEKLPSVTLATSAGPQTIALNPCLTVSENMAALFHKARRSKRGMDMLQIRIVAIQQQLDIASQAALTAQAAAATRPVNVAHRKAVATPRLPKSVQLFRSTEGFFLLRGRSAAGNGQLLKLAAPHDLWLHVGGAPGAHVLIRCDHPGQSIPQTTLTEAAILATLKSPRQAETTVEVITARAKYVHPVKGEGKAGSVRIDRYENTVFVSPDPEVEHRLELLTVTA